MGKKPLVVASKIKAYIKSRGAESSGEILDALSEKVMKLLDAAIANAKADERTVVGPGDFQGPNSNGDGTDAATKARTPGLNRGAVRAAADFD